MELRVVTDVEREMRDGIAPDRGGVVPKSREEILLPLTVRERFAMTALAAMLTLIGELPETEASVKLWKLGVSSFKTVTGVSWQGAPW